jgi:hypothetical protein
VPARVAAATELLAVIGDGEESLVARDERDSLYADLLNGLFDLGLDESHIAV